MVFLPLTLPSLAYTGDFRATNFCLLLLASVTMTTMRSRSGSSVHDFQQNLLTQSAASNISSSIIIPSIIRSIIRIHMDVGM